ncbi:MAG: AraC family transcriptional regulator, partial [Treponema sp.]|nr:AraC family transcriptional regulator [Treponema sp.]
MPGRSPPPPATLNYNRIHNDIIHFFHELAYVWTGCRPLRFIKTRASRSSLSTASWNVSSLMRRVALKDARIGKVVKYIARHYREKIAVKRMSGMTGLNAAYFGALFRRETGISLRHCLIQMRVKNAENMLRNGTLSAGDIAKRCGYNDAWHFCEQFKDARGYPVRRNSVILSPMAVSSVFFRSRTFRKKIDDNIVPGVDCRDDPP